MQLLLGRQIKAGQVVLAQDFMQCTFTLFIEQRSNRAIGEPPIQLIQLAVLCLLTLVLLCQLLTARNCFLPDWRYAGGTQ